MFQDVTSMDPVICIGCVFVFIGELIRYVTLSWYLHVRQPGNMGRMEEWRKDLLDGPLVLLCIGDADQWAPVS